MTETIDIDSLAAILRAAVRTEIMPRFRRLGEGDVREKTSAIDLVTEADEAAERFIKAECAAAFPDAVFVGEEGVAADPALLSAVGTAPLSIVVDPIDGTANFAAGAPVFGVMAAVVQGGETVAGVIYDPLGDDVMLAEKGGGTFLRHADGTSRRMRVAPSSAVGDMVGAASVSHSPPDERRRLLTALAEVRVLAHYRCAAHEYRLAASGFLDFLFYQTLMPWDHLAGSLLVTEAGGHVRRHDGAPYRPGDVGGGLLVATGEESWRSLRDLLFG